VVSRWSATSISRPPCARSRTPSRASPDRAFHTNHAHLKGEPSWTSS
jgi:hypothetical protein